MARRLSALRLVHPFPSLLNSVLVFGLALLASGDASRAALLAFAMLGMQFCIGTVNDLFDEQIDRGAKPWKPVAAGIVSRRAAWRVALVAGGGGLALAAIAGPTIAAMWLAMLASGLAYDARLKTTAWGWLCFAVAFAILPVYAWFGAAGQLPPRIEFLLPLAALAGPMIQLSNGLADLERDTAAGLKTLATRLGRGGSLVVVALLLATIHGVAWLTIVDPSNIAFVAAASGLALVGLALSASAQPARREVGWMIQACAIAGLAMAWLLSAS